ncbi:MAG: lyase family protein [Amaricoccus sp.]|uniref:lyase family protein n=1 Tax=Amaricoccus sp. TaxID=1872485 RepID=UPI0039E49AA9
MISPFDGEITAGLYGDAEVAALFASEAEVRAMLRVEGALASVEAALGIIPDEAGRAIAAAAGTVIIPPASLAAGFASAGVPVSALVKEFRAQLAPEVGQWVHWGATSQDVVDTGLVLRLRPLLDLLDARLDALTRALARAAASHRDTVLPARTRFQVATPTTLGAKLAVWTAPLVRHRVRLAELRPRLLRVSLAGASGTNAALQGKGEAVVAGLADALDLGASPVPWHAARDTMLELGSWFALVTGSLGKIGMDLILLGQSEIGEVTAGSGGGSSTMPHKANPVVPEALVALARVTAGNLGTLAQAMVHAEERDGTALGLEWFTLPQMAVAAGAALRHGLALAETLKPHPDRIARTFAGDRGMMMAEAAVFALAGEMPRPEAQALVTAAVKAAGRDGTLAAALAAAAPGRDWPALLDPAHGVGDAPRIADAAGEIVASGRG